jgi:hypothetical protein
MGIKQTLDVINDMEREGIISRYAIGGAVAAYKYVEPAVTEDLDIFVSFDPGVASKIITLEPILKFLRARGYKDFRKEGIVVEGWPVQFLPVADALDAEALAEADHVDVKANGGRVRARVMKPEHLVALALRVGRPKDYLRVTQFLQERAVTLKALKSVVVKHKLQAPWQAFCRKTGMRDLLALK